VYSLPWLDNFKKLSIRNLTGALANATLTVFASGGKSFSPVYKKSFIIAGAPPLQSMPTKRFLPFSQVSYGKAI